MEKLKIKIFSFQLNLKSLSQLNDHFIHCILFFFLNSVVFLNMKIILRMLAILVEEEFQKKYPFKIPSKRYVWSMYTVNNSENNF